MAEGIKKIGFLVSGRGSNMAAVLEEVNSGRLAAEVRVAVCDKPEAPALALAARLGLPAVIIRRENFPQRRGFEEALVLALKEHGVNLVVLAGFMRILGPAFLEAFPGRVINIHPSLLPAFPGLEAQRKALDHGVKIAGSTVHYVNEVVDGGRIIAQAAVTVEPGDTVESLSARILAQEHRLLARAIAGLGDLNPRKNNGPGGLIHSEEISAAREERLKILVVGSGAREHALAWKLAQSHQAASVKVAPGNAGLPFDTVPLAVTDHEGLINYARAEKVDLVVIGPEGPLAGSLVDKLEEAGLKVFGPRASAARLESSKAFAKEFMARHGIPTAAFRIFTSSDEAQAYLAEKSEGPVVVKASGLAAGKGVVVAANRAEAAGAVREIMEGGRFGEAGREVVIEDFIEGEEVSVLAFTDGRTLRAMPAVQDHKRLGEGDTGPNTGGLGAYCPVTLYTPQMAARVEETILRPTLAGLAADGLNFRGCLYFGLILAPPGPPGALYEGPQVVEYNARFGDPETQVLMPLLKSDLVDIMLRCIEGRLAGAEIEWREENCACVVIASGGYPDESRVGLVVTENIPGPTGASLAFHAGTALNAAQQVVTTGGRVISIVARALTLERALAKVYARVEAIHFEGAYYRRDIGYRELDRRKDG